MKRFLHFKNHILSVIFGLFLFLSYIPVHSEGVEQITEGTEYWFAIPYCKMLQTEPIRGEYPIVLWISSKVDTKATVTAGAISYQQTFNITANEITQVPLSDVLMCNEGEIVRRNGINIKSNDPISVCVYQSYKWSGEAFRVIPVDWLGKKYLSLNLYQDETDEIKPAQILIVATEDNTSVKYIPPKPTEKVGAGQTGTAYLMKGETFLILSKPDPAATQDFNFDITGTYITSNKPIVVISGHTKGSFPRFYVGSRSGWSEPYANFSRNMLIETMWPIELLGKEYISAPIKYNARPYIPIVVADIKGDLIRFVASEDGTVIEQLRKDGSSFMPISPTLKRGQWFNLTNMEDAALYRSTKPFLVGQYGKTWWNENGMMGIVKDGDQPQNPHLSGQGMMLVLAPIDRWISYANFKSPESIDNFVYLTFKIDDYAKIKFDGQSLLAKWGSAVKEIPGTPYGYVAQNIPVGNHWVEAEDSIRFAGYAYGNWDRTKDGFAYGYPIGVNYATPCEDTIKVTETIVCGKIDGRVTVTPDGADCATLFSVRFLKDQSVNYQDAIISDYERGVDRTATFKIDPIDPTKPGKAVMTFMTKSGKSIVKTYTYEPEDIVGEPNKLDFGLLKEGESKCLKFKLKNSGKVDATVGNPLRLMNGRAEFVINSTGLPVTLKPGETKEIEVCATALQLLPGIIKDSVIADLSCAPKPIVELRFVTGDTKVTIGDADFESGPINVERFKDVVIENIGSTPVELYSIDWADKLHFKRYENLTFPLVLEKYGDKHTFKVVYVADIPGIEHTDRAIFTGNTDQVKLYSDWKGIGTNATPFILGYDWLKQRVIDNYSINKLGITEYPGTVRITNTGTTAPLDVVEVKIIDDPDGVFRLNLAGLPNQLNPVQSHDIQAFFAPKDQKEYTSKVKFYAKFNNKIDSVEAVLHGIGIQPHIEIEGKTFPTPLLVGESDNGNGKLTSFVKFTPLTEMILTIKSGVTIEGADASAFAIDQSFFSAHPYPISLSPGVSIDVPIVFTAKKPGKHEANLVVKEHDAPETPVGLLVGFGRTEGLEATNHDFGLDFVTKKNTGVVTLTNTGTTSAIINEAPVVTSVNSNNDYQNFTILRFYTSSITNVDFPFELKANDVLNVEVEFTRTQPKTYEAKIDYITTIGTATSLLFGEGKVIRTVVRIPHYTTRADGSQIVPGDVVTVEVFLDKHQNETADILTADIKSFEATVNFKPENRGEIIDVYPVTSGGNGKIAASDIKTAGTLTNGWTVDKVEIIDNKTLKVNMSGSTALKNSGVLFKFDVNTFLSDLKKVPLEPEMNPLVPYVFVDTVCGSISVSPVCVNDLRLVILTNNEYSLSQIKPNPIENSGTIEYSLGLKAHTKLTLFDSFGDEVAVLVNQEQDRGPHKVNINVNELKLSSGVYYYKLESGPYSKTESLVITK